MAAEGACHRFDPARVDLGGVAGEEAGGVHEFAGHDPLRRGGLVLRRRFAVGVNDVWRRLFLSALLLGEGGGWVYGEAESVCAAVVALFRIVVSEASEQAREYGAVDRGGGFLLGASGGFGEGEAEMVAELFELTCEVAPFAHLGVGEVCLLREGAAFCL